MSRKLKKIDLKETSELEPLLLKDLGVIEQGLCVIDRQLSVQDAGRPDILAVDEEGTAVVMELKNETATVEHVDQALRYYEWVRQNLAWLSRAYPKITAQNDPRVLLVAPCFGPGVLRLAKYLEVNLELISYIAVRDEESEDVGLLCETVDIETPPEPFRMRSVDDIVAYCTDEAVNAEIKKVIACLQERGCKVRPYKGGKWICLEFLIDGEDYLWIDVRRKWFLFRYWVKSKQETATHPQRFTSFADWERECKKYVDECFS